MELVDDMRRYTKGIDFKHNITSEYHPLMKGCNSILLPNKYELIDKSYINPIIYYIFYREAASAIEEMMKFLKLKRKSSSFKIIINIQFIQWYCRINIFQFVQL